MLGFSEYFEPLLSIQRLPDDGHPLDILPENERMSVILSIFFLKMKEYRSSSRYSSRKVTDVGHPLDIPPEDQRKSVIL
jgi:hypothetical protein